MPDVPQIHSTYPDGLMYRIPVVDPQPTKIIVCGPKKPMSKKTIDGVVKLADAVAKEYAHEPDPPKQKVKVRRRAPALPKQPSRKCSWCGGSVTGADIHPHCSEIRDQVRASK